MADGAIAGQVNLDAQVTAFVREHVMPHSLDWDARGAVPPELLAGVAEQGFLGVLVSEKFGGSEITALEYGRMVEKFAYASASLATLFTVHGMVCKALAEFGTESQQREWLPKLATGQDVGAFCLTEAQAGSDAAAISAQATDDGDDIVLSGQKRWATFGQCATVFVVFAQYDGDPCAFLVPADAKGISRTPVSGMSGLQSAMLADITLDEVRLSRDHLLGRRGGGLSQVAAATLVQGRFSVAWSCVGLLQACCAEARRHTVTREQFGRRLSGHQLVQQKLTHMQVGLRAARDVCTSTATAVDEGLINALIDTCIAKYLASTSAAEAARDVVQLHGAVGCQLGTKAQQLQRDAVIMEIIEGTTQIQETIIGRSAQLEALIST